MCCYQNGGSCHIIAIELQNMWVCGEADEHIELNSTVSQNVFTNYSKGLKRKRNSDVADSVFSVSSMYMRVK